MVSIVNAVKDIERLRQITMVLMRHGFGELVARTDLRALVSGRTKPEGDAGAQAKRMSFGERLRLVLQDLGPSFIKLGQIISTRPDLIPADVIQELKKLQDDVPPIPIEEVKSVIEETLGATASQLFSAFDEKPLACASVGQVHRARLRDGAQELEVVAKVQRPRIRQTIERDLDLLYFLARLTERAIPESKIYSPVGLVGEFDKAIMAELDFTTEAENAEKFTRNFSGNPTCRFPLVYRQATGKRVVTLEFFDGKKIYAAVEGGASGERIAKNAVHIIAQMIFEDGFFHADPHPGNVLILGSPLEPVIGFLDLGLVGRITPEMRDKAIDLMVAAVRQETDALADALIAMGRPRGKVDMAAFRAEVAVLSEKYLGKELRDVQLSAMIRDLVQGAIKYEIEMPTEIVMVGKALMTVEGIGKEIYPELDVWSELRPYFLKLLWKRYHPERISRELLRGIAQVGTATAKFPGQLHSILEDLRTGRLELRSTDPALPPAADRLGRRIYSSLTIGAFTLSGAGLLAAGRYEGLGQALLALAGMQLILHTIGDLRRKYGRTR
ncbi:MAG: AarF/ABC1/UbiB kinase family protein [Deltaproteobacteria bacterium]|nr:AarF/ABC1/UbiB kinase family protein [Deltaproteobacteria bacterium]